MSLIRISNLTFAYPGAYDNVFESVSVELDSSWKLGLIGRNGRGKTTLFRLLRGDYEFRGSIQSELSFEIFPYEVRDKAQTVSQVAYELYPDYEDWALRREFSLLGLKPDIEYCLFETLSHGERTKVLLAILFLKPNAFVLIDEPTNHLDTESRRILANYLNQKTGFILISHDRAVLDECVDHVMSINREGITVLKGNYSVWAENKRRNDEFELAENKKLGKEISRLKESARRTALWSDKAEGGKIGFDPRRVEKNMGMRAYEGEKARKMMSRAKNTEARRLGAAEEKKKLLHNLEEAEMLKLSPLAYRGDVLVRGDKIAMGYSEAPLFENLSFTVNRGDRIALTGKNGSGKSTLIKAILGEMKPQKGTFFTGAGLTVSHVQQDTSHLRGALKAFAGEMGVDYTMLLTLLRKLDFGRAQFEKPMEDFSEGQKKKVLLSASLCTRAHLYIWDEPLNFIDILSRGQIEELIVKYAPTMLFVEHDRAFAKNVATKEIKL